MLGLVQDEPADRDRREEVEGLTFVIDATLAGHLERHLPLAVDYSEDSWEGLTVRPTRQGCC